MLAAGKSADGCAHAIDLGCSAFYVSCSCGRKDYIICLPVGCIADGYVHTGSVGYGLDMPRGELKRDRCNE